MQESKPTVGRRAVLGGAAVAGAAATVAALAPVRPEPVAQALPAGAPAEDKPAGYQLTEHVKRYYATARV